MLPQVNAEITAVKGGGYAADYDQPEGADTVKWSGRVGAYVKERVRALATAGRLDEFKQTSLIVPVLDPPVDIKTGDTVEFDYAGAARTRKVSETEAFLLPGAPETVRIYLADG